MPEASHQSNSGGYPPGVALNAPLAASRDCRHESARLDGMLDDRCERLQAREFPDEPDLTARARAEAQRILDAEARRLLDAKLDRDTASTATGRDKHTSHDSTDQSASRLDAQRLPVRRRAHDQGGAEAA
jgi:hypothetical protein